MTSKVDLSHLSPSDFVDWIRTLERDVASLRLELQKVEERLAWAQKGQALFAPLCHAPSAQPEGEAPLSTASGLPMPTAAQSNDTPPSLRQAVLRVFLDAPAGPREPKWPASKVIEELERHGWMPDGKYGPSTVRGMLRDLAKRGQLVRLDRATYALAPDARAQGNLLLAKATQGFAGSTQQQIVDAVTHFKRPATPSEIVGLLESMGLRVNKGSIQNALPRLVSRGTLVRMDGGRYALASRNGFSSEPQSGPSENGTRDPLFTDARPQEATNE
jgi:hypothetical protein